MTSTNALTVYNEIGGTISLVNFLEKICQSIICVAVAANMVDESDDETDKLLTKCHPTAKDIPSYIRYDKYIH